MLHRKPRYPLWLWLNGRLTERLTGLTGLLTGLTAALLLSSLATAQPDAKAFTAAKPPRLLSAYGLFEDATAQLPAAGVLPYDLITPLYSDYSVKFRFIYLPVGKSMGYRPSGVLDFPVGSALVKTFAYPISDPGISGKNQPASSGPRRWRLLETRLLIRQADGWQARVYVWNPEQTEAHYKVAGRTIPIDWIQVGDSTGPLRYRVPNLNQCASCHSSNDTLVPLGPKARNLNKHFDYGTFAMTWPTQNQLRAWAKAGLLTGLPATPPQARVVRWDDPSEPLHLRARAYLDVNCGHCHQPAGVGSTSGLYLHWEENRPVHLGVGKRPVAAGRGSGGLNFAIVPGHPEQSILLYRMQSSDPAIRMPEISVALPHREGIELIRQWLLAMPQ